MIIKYFLIAFALCWAITIPIALRVQGLATVPFPPNVAQWAIGFVPLIAALFCLDPGVEGSAKTYFRNVLRWKAKPQWFLLAAALPWLILAGSLAVGGLIGAAPPDLSFSPAMLGVFLVVWIVLAFGEEAGWRGFALPRLTARFGFWKASTLLGILWCVWHYPKLFCSPYMALNHEGLMWLGMFSLQIFIANYLICWLYAKTESVLVCTFFHASFNTVATVHSMAAIDACMTAVLAVIALGVLIYDRKSLSTWQGAPFRSSAG